MSSSSSSSKHLKELLKEDQEPFILNDKLSTTHLQLKKRKPVSSNACFFASSTYSPDVKKSPLFYFRSPVKSPCRKVQIPPRTASLLLEAALRIQKNSALKKSSSRKHIGFGLFGSILKRLTSRKKHPKNECNVTEERVLIKDLIRWDSMNFAQEMQEKEELDMGFEDKRGLSCSCTSTLSSVWSESNVEKSFDLETSSSRSEDSVNMEFVDDVHKGFCASPFRFALHKSPEFDSPMLSPSRINQKVADSANRSVVGEGCEEEDKEQNSPVSVLDPPFEDDDDDDQEDDEAEDCFELVRNFTNVQRAKQQLMHKLRRFEILAELDPIELEKRIVEQEDEERFDDTDDVSVLSDSENHDSVFVRELLTQSNTYNHHKIPSDMQRLVLDLVGEEVRKESLPCSKESVAEKVCKRLEAWKEVEFNTIDMMVEFDFRMDANEWAKNPEQMQETTADIELAIFGFLVDELADELVQPIKA